MTDRLRYPWLVTDLDGTLVDRDLRIPRRNLEALDRYRIAGGTVIIATGRNERSASRFYEQLALETPAILYNGARMVDLRSGDRLLDLSLDESWPVLRDEALTELPGTVGAVAFHGLDVFVLKPAPALAQYATRDQIELRHEPPPACPTKVMVIAESPADLTPVADQVAALAPGIRMVSSEKTYLELLPANADKGSALRLLAGICGVPLDQIASVGDNPNDLELIQVAGLGAAAADGHSDLLAVADVTVAACSQGTVADLVERYLLVPE